MKIVDARAISVWAVDPRDGSDNYLPVSENPMVMMSIDWTNWNLWHIWPSAFSIAVIYFLSSSLKQKRLQLRNYKKIKLNHQGGAELQAFL